MTFGAASAAVRFGRAVATTAAFNIAASAAAGGAGILVARALGPTVRGEYAAVVAWFGAVLVLGELGQTAATTYFVARHRDRAGDYLATSRTMMICSGLVALGIGLAITPLLAGGNGPLAWGYRLMFGTCLVSFVSASYVFSLQAVNLRLWNLVRVSQPVLYLLAVSVLHLVGGLDLLPALAAVVFTVVVQTVLAHGMCRRQSMLGGHTDRRLVRPMVRYGMGQLAASAPLLISTRLDQLVLSLTVLPAALGQYAVASSATTAAVPIVAAVGNVAFPRLASRVLSGHGQARLLRWSLLSSAGMSLAFMLVLASSASWLVPTLFGPSYAEAVTLIWLLAPGGVFLACGQVCGDLLRGYGRPMAVARAQWVAAITTVALLVVLLPLVGAAGAAIASSTSYGLALILMVLSLRAVDDVDHPATTDPRPAGVATPQPIGSEAP